MDGRSGRGAVLASFLNAGLPAILGAHGSDANKFIWHWREKTSGYPRFGKVT